MFTRQHYKEIAGIIWWSSYDGAAKEDDLSLKDNVNKTVLINSFCTYFKKDNPKFDEEEFRKACRNE